MSNSDHGDDGLRKGLTSYGDRDFSRFLRKAFIKGAGYSDEALERPIVVIANTVSAYWRSSLPKAGCESTRAEAG